MVIMFQQVTTNPQNYTYFSKVFLTLFMLSAAGKTSLMDFLTSDIYMLLLAMNDFSFFAFKIWNLSINPNS
jgi:hypothetical protein